MDFLAQVVVWLNTVANAVGGWLLSSMDGLPGWLSATLIAAVTGVLLLLVFKYTSNQRAIKRVRADIKANLLALKLFKDSGSTVLEAQAHVFGGAFRLLVLAIMPMLVMIVPVLLILGQLSLWYESRPLQVAEEARVILKLNGVVGSPLPEARLQPTDAADVLIGPVRVFSKREVYWTIAAKKGGYHRLVFEVDGQAADKELAIGDGPMRVSSKRPGWSAGDVLLYPWEPPFRADAPIQSIDIKYPDRPEWTSGAGFRFLRISSWVYFWFVVSLVAGFCFRGVLHVNI